MVECCGNFGLQYEERVRQFLQCGGLFEKFAKLENCQRSICYEEFEVDIQSVDDWNCQCDFSAASAWRGY